MPEDANGSGLVTLVWALWIYWTVSWWYEHLSSLSRAKKEPQAGAIGSPTGTAIAPLQGSAASSGLDALVSEFLRRYGPVTVSEFLGQRLGDYESIVAAFDAGDRAMLRKLVSADVYDTFSEAIADREARHEGTETMFSLIEPPEILSGLINDSCPEITIRFKAEFYKLTRNASGQAIGRAPERHQSIDIWTFGCTSSRPSGRWLLVATEVGAT
jgi:predicted lipid-binding transport protein (Tim44 family)